MHILHRFFFVYYRGSLDEAKSQQKGKKLYYKGEFVHDNYLQKVSGTGMTSVPSLATFSP